MGKFNSADGVNFSRTINDVVKDYASYLLQKGLINEQEFITYTSDKKAELLDILFDKLYEFETHNGNEVLL